ncbi:MAG TPA: radical SAM protein [Dehalococcoidia bacterium]|nr:radical SAM protein [Dehalococcoidia bacterium]
MDSRKPARLEFPCEDHTWSAFSPGNPDEAPRRCRPRYFTLTSKEIAPAWPGPPTNDGRGIFFISHLGEIYPSDFMPVSTGNARKDSLVDIYRNSRALRTLRERSSLGGKCGYCPFNVICGGSRSWTYAMTGDMYAADPTCSFQPPEPAVIGA